MAQNTLLERVLSLQDKFQSLQDQLASPEVMSDMKKQRSLINQASCLCKRGILPELLISSN